LRLNYCYRLDQVEMNVILSDSDKSYLDLIPMSGIPYSDHIKWVTLESTLESYLEMTEQRRVIASYKPPESGGPGGTYPWHLSQDDDLAVDDTILAWDNLLSAIQTRMPAGEKPRRPQFYSSASIESCEIQGLFVKKFLQRARIPPFQYIAPGLRLSTNQDLSNQPFKNASLEKLGRRPRQSPSSFSNWCYPFLFLRFDQKIQLDPSCRYKRFLTGSEYRYNGYPWQHATEFETGLYITGAKLMERPDGAKLLLPFQLAPNKWAKFGDGNLIHAEHSYDGLYQPSRDSTYHWAMMWAQGDDVPWNVRLEILFKKWTWMIENGHWEVGEDGVVGGAEKFKEADSEDKRHLYFIQTTW
jgi:hypothetical protein